MTHFFGTSRQPSSLRPLRGLMVATVTGTTVELVTVAVVAVVTPAVLCLVAKVSTLELRGDNTLSLHNAALTVAVLVTTGCIV